MKYTSDLKRRSFLVGSAICCFASCSPLPFSVGSASAGDAGADKAAVERWMNDWMGRKSPAGMLHVSRFKDRIWFLTKPIGWKPEGAASERYQPLEVPTGFVTDFASIPRLFWSLLPPDGEYTYPAIIHDYLYWTQDRPREEADEILKIGMQEFGIRASIVTAIYSAVRVGGGSAWTENARLRSAGEKRLLARFPDDPRIRWSDWKKRDGVFL